MFPSLKCLIADEDDNTLILLVHGAACAMFEMLFKKDRKYAVEISDVQVAKECGVLRVNHKTRTVIRTKVLEIFFLILWECTEGKCSHFKYFPNLFCRMFPK